MYEFRVSLIRSGPRWYLLLPKLNLGQDSELSRRLSSRGFAVRVGRTLLAKRGAEKIHLDPSGVRWSLGDPSDAFLPLIPDLLQLPREETSVRECREMYLSKGRVDGVGVVRFKTRAEVALWKGLRERGESALTPDERAVIAEVIKGSRGRVRLITDFPNGTSTMIRVGRNLYFETELHPDEAMSTLRSIESKGPRNSYLPKDGLLVHRGSGPSILSDFFKGLGEWFCFTPQGSKSSNPRRQGLRSAPVV